MAHGRRQRSHQGDHQSRFPAKPADSVCQDVKPAKQIIEEMVAEAKEQIDGGAHMVRARL